MVDDPSVDDADDVDVDIDDEIDDGQGPSESTGAARSSPPPAVPSDAPTIPGRSLLDDDGEPEPGALDGAEVVTPKPSVPKRPPPPSRAPAKSVPPRPGKKTAPLPSSRPLSRPPGSRISELPAAPAARSSRPPAALSPSGHPVSRPPDVGDEDAWDKPAKAPRLPSDLGPDSEDSGGPPPAEALTALTLGDFDDEGFDGAKTQRIVRGSSPPNEADAKGYERSARKSRKGRRRIVQIPDDAVPTATPKEADDVEEKAETQLRMSPVTGIDEPEPTSQPLSREDAVALRAEVESAEDEDHAPATDRMTADLLEEAEELDADVLEEEEDEDDDGGDDPAEGDRDSAEELDVDELEEERAIAAPPTPSSKPPAANQENVVTDGSIGLVRPIQIVSDLPAMAMPTEEIEPEALEPPGPPPAPAEVTDGAPRRPPPPRRPETSEVDAEEKRPLPPPRAEMTSSEVLTAESELALAEARAKEALAKAKEAEARAREAAAKASRKKPWWAVMFEDDLIRTLDNPRKKDVERDATFIEKTLRLEPGARILDLACGTGVHAVELASRGYQVVGVDYSNTMLELAKQYNSQRGGSVSFIQGDMRKLNLEEVFDGIYCWASSFGFFDDAANANVLERVARALRPGGTFTLDVCNRDFISSRAPSMAWFEKPGVVCMDDMRFDFYASRMITKRMVLFDSGKSREVETSIRLYTLHELGRLMHKVGFKVLEVSGHRATRGAYFGSNSPQIIITGQRRKD